MTTTNRTRRPSVPGAILAELCLARHEISIARFADACGVTRKHVSRIVNGHVAITAEMAARMAAVLSTTAQYWLNLQNTVDLYEHRNASQHHDRGRCRSLLDRSAWLSRMAAPKTSKSSITLRRLWTR